MQAAELELDFDSAMPRARPGRALALITISVIAIVATGAAYLHPNFSFFPAGAGSAAGALRGDYRVAAIDFVNPTTGWIVVDFTSGDFGVIRTTDGGTTWTRQLAAPGGGHAKFIKFFDQSVGVFALLGTQPILHRTSDGGQTWVSRPALNPNTSALSWSFVDSDHGWMLVAETRQSESPPVRLFRTENGGLSWVDLGPPVHAPDQAFEVQFSDHTTGWLTTSSSGPYGYATQDFGASWARVPLPAPDGGWPRAGQFFVAMRPTVGQGVVASVVYFPPIKGRTGVGGTIRAYPPLTVRAFDGGRPRTYTYTTLLDQVVTGPFAKEPPPNQTRLGTTDGGRSWSTVAPPSGNGAIGYFDAAHWWWIGDGMWASSSDGGATWSEPLDIGVITPLPGSLQMLDREHAWFAGMAGPRSMLETTDDAGVHWTLMTLPLLEDRPTPDQL